MAAPNQSPAKVAFGPFEVNASTGELRRSGVRVRLSGQPFQILLILLAHPGEVVAREQLREAVWGDGTFVDFEHGLNAVVNKLRRALGDSAENPRYIETVQGRGYRFIGALASRHGPVPLATIPAKLPPRRRRFPRWWAAVIAAAVGLSLVVGVRFYRSATNSPAWRLTRLTRDAGLTDSPALSPDGKLLAYSSDSNSAGERDLYIKQVAGGQPIRLTFDGAGNTTPDFSPDGSTIVFRSDRDGGGIYSIPAFGGEAQLLTRDGLNPRFSPDGSQVAYWIGAKNVSEQVPGSGTIWVVPAGGGQPRRVGVNFTTARYPIWSADGKHLLFVGYTSARAYENSGFDWWVIAPDGGDAVKTGAHDLLVANRLRGKAYGSVVIPTMLMLPKPGCWSATNAVTFDAVRDEASTLWELGISPQTGKVSGAIGKLTTGVGSELNPSCATNGITAFTKAETRDDVWLLPFDLDRGKATGAPERVTQTPGFRDHASLSGNGRFFAFASDQSGKLNIWTRDVATGKESIMANSSLVQRFPVVDASGDRIAYSVYEEGKRLVYMSSLGGKPKKLCEGCLHATDWSRDSKTLLVFGGNPYRISALDVASQRQAQLLKHGEYNLLYGRFSPDNRWVSFTVRTGPNHARIAVAPVDGPKPVSESAWIQIAEEGAEDWANWSTDGKTLYFTSGRDGHTCLWGRRIEAGSHRPVGEAFAVQHFHGRASYQQGGWSAAGGRIAMVLREDTGNIWVMSRQDTH
jgi:eukaryotic-like serine/threonine-protein kinase